MPEPGQTISEYLILEKLGEGGMGVVYKAEDTKLGRLVALKFLTDRALRIGEARKRFLREAQASAKLDHPNICAVYELEEAEGELFLAMAYLEGETLQQRLGGGALPVREALEIALQTAEGLQEAHEHGVIHRDIKPANIFLTRKGLAKITDFGLAYLEGRSRITKSGSTLGTVNYMSPEQLLGETVDRRADIWSLGVVLYEMLCGARPFQSSDAHGAMRMILQAQPRSAAKARRDCPAELDRLVNKALSKSREERYQHVDDMVVDLRAVLEALPAGERPAPAVRPTAPPRDDAPTETVVVTAPLTSPEPGRRGSGLTLAAFGILILAGVLFAWWRFLQN